MVSSTRSGRIHADNSRETKNTEKHKDVKGSTSIALKSSVNSAKAGNNKGLEAHDKTKTNAPSLGRSAGSTLTKRNSVSDSSTRRSCRHENNATLYSPIKKDLKIEKTCDSPLRRSERIEKHNISNSKDNIEKTISELIAERRMTDEKSASVRQEKYVTVRGHKRKLLSASTYVSLVSTASVSKKCKHSDISGRHGKMSDASQVAKDISKMHEKVNDTSQGATSTLGEDSPNDEMKIETLVQETVSRDSTSSVSKRCNLIESSDVHHEQRIGQESQDTQTQEFCPDSACMHQSVLNTLSSKDSSVKDHENISASHMDEVGGRSGEEVEELDVPREQSHNKRENVMVIDVVDDPTNEGCDAKGNSEQRVADMDQSTNQRENEASIEDDQVTTKVDRKGNGDGICVTGMKMDTVISNVQTEAEGNVCIVCKHPGTLLCCNGKDCNRSYHISCLSFPLEKLPPRMFLCSYCVGMKMASGVGPVSGGLESVLDTEVLQMENCSGENQNSVNGLTISHEPDANVSLSKNRFEVCANVSNPDSSKPDSSSSRFLEFWVPVQLSNVQLEQYCSIMLSNSTVLRSCSSSRVLTEVSNDIIFSTRKCCDHPYLVHASLQASLTQGLPQTEYLDIGVHASGKLEFLDKILHGLKQQELRAVIIFHQFLVGDVKISIGDILDDFLRQRFGVESYERVDSGLIMAKKQVSLQSFNDKERGRFVFLVENRACLPSIKLSAVDTVIIFGSDWNPLYDLKALNKISIDSQFEQIKVFRLYCLDTVEENILSLAKQDVILESTAQNLNRRCHPLLSLGASHLFDELDKFHKNVSPLESLKTSHQNSLLDDTVSEVLSQIAHAAGKTNVTSPSIISKAQHCGTVYSRSISLFREKEIQMTDVEPSQVFWPKLLDGRCPQWRYITGHSQRARRKVQQNNEEPLSLRDENDDARKKRKKVSVNIADPVPLAPIVTHDKRKEASPELQADHSSKESELSKVSCGIGSLRTLQRNLHLSLKPELAKICDILHLPGDVKIVLESFLDYIMNNLHVIQEPITLFQAFKLSLCWRAASFLKCKVDHKESLALVRKELSYECSEIEAESVYSKLHMLKKRFPLQTNTSLKCIEPNQLAIQSAGPLDENKGKHFDPISLESSPSGFQKVEGAIIQKQAVRLEEFDTPLESQKQSLMLGNITSVGNASASLDQVCSSPGNGIVQNTGPSQTTSDPNPSIQPLNNVESDALHSGLLPNSSLPIMARTIQSNDCLPHVDCGRSIESNGIGAQTSCSVQSTENANIHVTDAAPVTQGENPVVSQMCVISQTDVVPPINHEKIVAVGAVEQNSSHPVVSSLHEQLTPTRQASHSEFLVPSQNGPANFPDGQADLPRQNSDELRGAFIMQQQSGINVTQPIFITARLPSQGLYSDPLENEKLRITKELETAVQMFEDAKLRLRGQYEIELDMLVKKYESLIRNEEKSFIERKKTLLMLQKTIHLNQILAKEFSHKFSDNNSVASKAGNSQGRVQQYAQISVSSSPMATPNVTTTAASIPNPNPVLVSNQARTLPQHHKHYRTQYSQIAVSSSPMTATPIAAPNVATDSIPNPNTNPVLVSSEARTLMQPHHFRTQYTQIAVSSSPMTVTPMATPNVSTIVSIPNPNPARVSSQARTSPQPRLFRQSPPHAQMVVSSSSFPTTHIAASNVSMNNSNLVRVPNQARTIQHPNAFLTQNFQIPASSSPMTTRTMASPNVSTLSIPNNSNLVSSQPRNNIVSPSITNSASITTPTSMLPVQVVSHSSELFSNNPGRPNILQVGTATASPAPHLRSFVRPVLSNTPTIPLPSPTTHPRPTLPTTQHLQPLTPLVRAIPNTLALSSTDPLFSSANENKTNQISGNISVPTVEPLSLQISPLSQPSVPMDSNRTQPSLPPTSSIERLQPQHLDLNQASHAEMMFSRGGFPSATYADETATAAPGKLVCLSSDEDT